MKRRRLGRGMSDLVAVPPARVAPSEDPAGRPAGAPGATVVAVAGACPRAGTSALTVNVAAHLAASGLRVLAIDADPGGTPGLHALLGLRPARTLQDVISGAAGLEAVAEIGPVGIRLVAGSPAPHNAEALSRAIGGTAGRTELILIDAGAGAGRGAALLGARDAVIVVTTPALPSMQEAYGVIKGLLRQGPDARLHLVVNRAASAFEALEVSGQIDRTAQRFLGRSLVYLGHVLEDDRVPDSIEAGVPIVLHHPASPAAACYRGVGRALLLEIGRRRAAGPSPAG